MTIENYFGKWSKVVDLKEAERVTKILLKEKQVICPLVKNLFRAFQLCNYDNLKVIIIGQDPYPQVIKGVPVAQGIAFANSNKTPVEEWSPSLKILSDSVMDFSSPHPPATFDPTMEEWEKQGVLLLNAALSCKAGMAGSHTLLWRPFLVSFMKKLSEEMTGLVYILMGQTAQSFEYLIDKRYNKIFKIAHPSWYARNRKEMPSDLWKEINYILKGMYGYGIEWVKEIISEQESKKCNSERICRNFVPQHT